MPSSLPHSPAASLENDQDLTWPQGQNAPDPGRFEMSIDTLVRLAAARSGEAAAVLWRDQTISYAALDQHIDCCAATLIDRFAETNADHLAGQRFGISVKKDPANLILFFAILRAGGIAVPLNPALKAEQWAYIAANCDMTAGFVSEAQCEALKGETAWSPIVSGDPSGALKALSDEAAFDGQVFCQCQPKDTAILFYTSGSTGHPKGVMVSHHANVLGAASVGHYLQLRPDDRILTVLPLSFDYGFNQITSSWLAGAAVVLHDYFLASDVPKMVAKSGVTGLAAVPPLWHLLLAKPWPQEAAASLRFVTNSGGTLSQDLQAKMRSVFPNADIYAMYGLTEAFRSTVMPPGRLASKPTSIGQAIPFAKVAAMLPDGAQAPPGQPGELVHTGPLVALGYWNDKERTARRFRPVPEGLNGATGSTPDDVCVFSGDEVTVDEDGDFYFLGRMDDMIKVLGNRLSPQEIEDVVMSDSAVKVAAAFGLEDEQMGARIVVVVESDTQAADLPALDARLRQICRDRLPGYAQPSSVLVRKSLPRNPNGKVDRPSLKAWCAEQREEPDHGTS